MGVLEEIIQLRNRGISEEEIIQMMRDRGVSPREISDALNQVQIKNAVSDIQGVEMTESPVPQIPNQYVQEPIPEERYQENYSYQEPIQNYYQPIPEQQPTGIDTETIIDISEQVVIDKTSEIINQMRMFNEFKEITKIKLDQMDLRLKKIELIIDKLQISILEKIGSYGDNLNSIKKEMSMMQDSFSKIVDPLTKLKRIK